MTMTELTELFGWMTLTNIGLLVLRGTAEKTIRHQASSVYKKAGVSGRHAFSAWFIEDFL